MSKKKETRVFYFGIKKFKNIQVAVFERKNKHMVRNQI